MVEFALLCLRIGGEIQFYRFDIASQIWVEQIKGKDLIPDQKYLRELTSYIRLEHKRAKNGR